ncbi:hypothetical protein KFK09_012902 [Dendrobium nobile]|uniref:Uncharacterized protein n=1 Tax=Dendrobium nobile TaxID=94219 RepID=A0A8T3BIM1_DENNO|nr:hypothetical protein KFK09_012902 [Dendrobium nobile]
MHEDEFNRRNVATSDRSVAIRRLSHVLFLPYKLFSHVFPLALSFMDLYFTELVNLDTILASNLGMCLS